MHSSSRVPLWALLFADDILVTAGRIGEITDLGALPLGVGEPRGPSEVEIPMGGHQVSWIGYWLCLETCRLGVSESRARWICREDRGTLAEGYVDIRDFRAVLGRLSFTWGVLDYLKPFVSPPFSWAAAVDHLGKVTLPWSVSSIIDFIA